ncbi:MAG: hypothetical protein PHD48_06305 [Alphaproteobacteria bacterium]|nr:hypothetical protein [Alphaproteobacteria bacterium]
MSDDFGEDLMDRNRGEGESKAPSHLKDTPHRNETLITKDSPTACRPASEHHQGPGYDGLPANERFSVMPSTGKATHAEQMYKRPKSGRSANIAGQSSSSLSAPSAASQTTSLQFSGTGQNSKPIYDNERVTSENYTKIYLQRQREQEKLACEQKSMQSRMAHPAAQKQRDEETTLRVRARDLIAQIQWWRSQFGLTDHEPHYISGMISSLEQELHAIDPRYWP